MKLLLGYPPTPSFKFTERTFYIFRNERTNGFTPPPPLPPPFQASARHCLWSVMYVYVYYVFQPGGLQLY